MTAANDNMPVTELEMALKACPGPRSGDTGWQHRRHLVMMEFGVLVDGSGAAKWPAAAEYVRHQGDMEEALR